MVSVVISEIIIKALESNSGFSEANRCATYIEAMKKQECVGELLSQSM